MSARRYWLGILFAASLPLGYACGVNVIKATAATPNPTLYAKLQEGTVRIDVFDVPAGRVCSSIPGKRNFCVDQLSESLGAGLTNTLSRYMKPGSKDKTDFVTEFRMLEFKQTPSSRDAKAVQVSMRWKFSLKRLVDNQAMVDIDETTVAPTEVVRADLANDSVNPMINAVFERIGAELGKLDLSGQPPPPPAPPEPVDAAPPTVCVPNATQECVGAGACKGGQSCLPDGSGFSECDCGKKKKTNPWDKPKSGTAPAPASTPAPAPAPAPAGGELAP
jgi:hypothetical protein